MSIYRSRLTLNQPNKKEYTFLSRGPKGAIKKIVELEKIHENIFNVLLIDEVNGIRRDDTNMSENEDAIKVISTVVRVIEKFFDSFPGNAVYISGNTPVKKMIYQRKVYLMNQKKYLVLAKRISEQAFAPVQRPVNKDAVYNSFLVLPV